MNKKKKNLFEKVNYNLKRKCWKKDCIKAGVYKAPKSKNELKNYIWFCEDHIKEYNKKWDYCKDMSQIEIEKHIQLDTIGWRPTWNFSTSNLKLKNFEKIFINYFGFFKKKKKNQEKFIKRNSSFQNTLKILNIKSGEITMKTAENKYKQLVKKYHPDKNKGDKKYEEKLKKINQAFEEIKKNLL